MRILYIDTSSSFLYTGIVENDNLLCECQKEFGHELSKEALPEIAKLFEDNNIEPKDIDKIIVVNGPGSFTGVRIGVTIAKIYAWSLNIPISTITSLEAMTISQELDGLFVPVIDARRGYIFGAIYDDNYKELLKPQHIKINSLLNHLGSKKDFTIITNDEIEMEGKKISYHPNILKIVNYFKDKEEVNPHSVNPDYLKLTEAEEKMN